MYTYFQKYVLKELTLELNHLLSLVRPDGTAKCTGTWTVVPAFALTAKLPVMTQCHQLLSPSEIHSQIGHFTHTFTSLMVIASQLSWAHHGGQDAFGTDGLFSRVLLLLSLHLTLGHTVWKPCWKLLAH